MNNFEALQLSPEIVSGLHEIGIDEPTLIQQKAIPLILEGKDVIGMSKTGSGKTVAFGAPLLERIKLKAGLQVLIIAPTRELAVQIAKELQKFSKYRHCSIATVYGRVAISPQMEQIARSEIVVGTPGRLKDHLDRRTMNLSKITTVVLDEADKMVEMGFIEDINYILNYTPKEKQVLLFGATISTEIEHLKQRHMHQPVVAEAEKHVQEDLLEQYYYNVEQNEKFSLLVHLLKKEEVQLALVFCSARSTVELVAKNLRLNGVKAEMIHGKLSQHKRMATIENFNHGKMPILVASPVAARGLHIENVTHVINYDLSPDPQEYVHRIGRTARAGESGKAITLLSRRDYEAFGAVLNKYRLDVKELPREDFPRVRFETRGRVEGQHSLFGHRSFGPRGDSRRDFRGRERSTSGWRGRSENSSPRNSSGWRSGR